MTSTPPILAGGTAINGVDVSSSVFTEAVQSLQSALTQNSSNYERLKKEFGDYKFGMKKEQRLILSAWYDLGMQMQKRQVLGLSGIDGGASTPRIMSAATPLNEKSGKPTPRGSVAVNLPPSAGATWLAKMRATSVKK